MTLHDQLRARAAHGAALLDTARPGWHHDVHPGSLDIASNHHCVLGQLYGSYVSGVDAVFPEIGDIVNAVDWVRARSTQSDAHGFSAYDIVASDERAPWSELTCAWRDEITTRRLKAHANTIAPTDAAKEVVMSA